MKFRLSSHVFHDQELLFICAVKVEKWLLTPLFQMSNFPTGKFARCVDKTKMFNFSEKAFRKKAGWGFMVRCCAQRRDDSDTSSGVLCRVGLHLLEPVYSGTD